MVELDFKLLAMAGLENRSQRWLEVDHNEIPLGDVQIVTSDKRSMMAHSSVLVYSSPVLESMLMDRQIKRGNSDRVIHILGVPFEAVQAFIRFLYSGYRGLSPPVKETQEEMQDYGIHLLVLSHVYQIGWLKRACERAMAAPLSPENVIDILILANRCDAPSLYLHCMKLLFKEFQAVQKTEAWKFLQENDPYMELEILKFLQDTHLREKKRRRKKEEQKVYTELNEAMECLRHICMEGCTHVGPCGRRNHGRRPNPAGCPNLTTCYGLQQLLRHFFVCDKRTQHNCNRCNKLWQLLKLHASICDCEEQCQVPLCMQFKKKMQQDEKIDDKWLQLVNKVRSVRLISNLTKRKRQDEGIQLSRGLARLC